MQIGASGPRKQFPRGVLRSGPAGPGRWVASEVMDIRGLGYVILESTGLAREERFGCQVLGLMQNRGMPQEEMLQQKMAGYPWLYSLVPCRRDRIVALDWGDPG